MTRANIVRNIINDDGYYYTKHSVLEIVNVIFDEHEAQLKAKNERIRELEEAMKPKTCDGCKHLDGVICKHDRGLYCVRQFEADYFVKDNK